ncbi:unnamed protein product [Camellia sinensis]
MARLSPPHSKPVPNPLSLFAQTVTNHNGHNFPSTSCFFPWRIGPLTHKKNPLHIFPPPSKSLFTLNCTSKRIGDDILSTSSAYEVLGVVPNCSPAELKAAFRTKVKQYHPDVRKDGELSDTMIRHVIEAYQVIWDPYQSCKDVHPCHPVTFYHGCLKCLEVVESYHPDRVLRQLAECRQSLIYHLALCVFLEEPQLQYAQRMPQIYQITHPFVEAGYEDNVQHPDRLYYAIDAIEQLLQDQHISEATPSTSTQGQSARSSSNAHRFGAHYTCRSRS